jgi:GDPmannose 4,6-dehydratase
MKRALITGVTGQDGQYLAELLLEKGYEVYGGVRRVDVEHAAAMGELQGRVHLVRLDLADQDCIDAAVQQTQPHEIYHLAAQSSVPVSWQKPVMTSDVTGLGTARLLQALVDHLPDARFFHAGSSEMFGRTTESPQRETSPFAPHSPYGVAKLFAYHLTASFRERFGLFASTGILYNHESPRRSTHFVSRKITHGAARIALGLDRELRLGNLDARRDWGAAADYVRAMWLTLQADEPADYVIGTGQTRSVRDFVQTAFEHVGLDWERCVTIDPQSVRPNESIPLCADPTKARHVLRWRPEVTFEDMVRGMVDADLALLRRQMRPVPLPAAA